MPSTVFTLFSVLSLLAAGGLMGLGFLGLVWGIIQRNRLLIRRGLQLSAGVALAYLAVLGGVGLLSREQILPVGAEKYFCELDCHLAYSVEQVLPVEGGGDAGNWAVRVKTRFDQNTISPRRGNAPLWPNPRKVALVGSDGRWYAGEMKLGPSMLDASTPITTALRPGESYSTWIGFTLPAGVKPAHLEISEDIPVNGLLIGNERSLFHRPVLLALPG